MAKACNLNSVFILFYFSDRTVLIWNTKDFESRNRKSCRGNIEYDHAQHICWSPDSKAFIIFKAVESCIDVYKVKKKPDGALGEVQRAFSFPEVNMMKTFTPLDIFFFSFEFMYKYKLLFLNL